MSDRRLIIMRHAKSSWKSGATTDHARPLNKRGRRDAPAVAERLVELEWVPQRILSSDSQRTRETSELLLDVFGDDVQVDFLGSLYLAGMGELRLELAALPDDVTTVLAIGHNPGWQEVVAWLCGEWESMATANAALLETSAPSWPEALARRKSWTLETILRPKEL